VRNIPYVSPARLRSTLHAQGPVASQPTRSQRSLCANGYSVGSGRREDGAERAPQHSDFAPPPDRPQGSSLLSAPSGWRRSGHCATLPPPRPANAALRCERAERSTRPAPPPPPASASASAGRPHGKRRPLVRRSRPPISLGWRRRSACKSRMSNSCSIIKQQSAKLARNQTRWRHHSFGAKKLKNNNNINSGDCPTLAVVAPPPVSQAPHNPLPTAARPHYFRPAARQFRAGSAPQLLLLPLPQRALVPARSTGRTFALAGLANPLNGQTHGLTEGATQVSAPRAMVTWREP